MTALSAGQAAKLAYTEGRSHCLDFPLTSLPCSSKIPKANKKRNYSGPPEQHQPPFALRSCMSSLPLNTASVPFSPANFEVRRAGLWQHIAKSAKFADVRPASQLEVRPR